MIRFPFFRTRRSRGDFFLKTMYRRELASSFFVYLLFIILYRAICRDDGLPHPSFIFYYVCPFQGKMSRSDKGVTVHKKILLDFEVSIGIKEMRCYLYFILSCISLFCYKEWFADSLTIRKKEKVYK